MSTKDENRIELLPGRLELLIPRTLLFGPLHGHVIAKSIERDSEEVPAVEQGSLYPALHRLTAKRRWQLRTESAKWERLTRAIGRIGGRAAGGVKTKDTDGKTVGGTKSLQRTMRRPTSSRWSSRSAGSW
jgi:hypothetical protein